MFKFLHAADIHLDSPLRGLERYDGAPVDRIRNATRRAVERLVRLAIAEKVQFVLLAGDLYDGAWKDYNTGLFLMNQLRLLSDARIHVVLLAGNHDAANRMTRSLRFPAEFVHALPTDRPDTVLLPAWNVAVHGQGFARQAVIEDLSQAYPRAVPGCFNVGLLHTCASGLEGHERYAPCTVEGLRAKQYDYWALGHIHMRQVIHNDPPIVFPGNLQGRHVGELGPKGCLIVTVADPHSPPQVEFHRLDTVVWDVIDVPADQFDHMDDLIDGTAQTMTERIRAEDDDRLVAARVRVTGESPLHERLLANPARWSNEIRAQANAVGSDRLWLERVQFETRPPSLANDLGEDGPLATLQGLLDEIRSDPQQQQELLGLLKDLRRKLPPEWDAEGAPSLLDDPQWITGVLDRVGPLLVGRLQAGSRTTDLRP
ncbi:MAG TPA: DNA repair exonuclease [Isosphaeraceae bacterium]|jgi:DNA repair exonuclease SbcCD nuclease subunit|nr:DNA repair exonuclease [Isosphaeraceae bacterium]